MTYRKFWLMLLLLVCPLSRSMAQATTNSDILQLVPSNAVAIFQLPNPRTTVERMLAYIHQLELTRFDEVQELLQSTPYQRFTHFIQFLEEQYARPWPKLLDDISGKGIALALTPVAGSKDMQVLGIIQAQQSDILKQAYRAALEVMKQEAEQNDQPTPFKQKLYRNIQVTSVGDKFFLAQQQSHVFLSSNIGLITGALDQLLDHNQLSILQHSRFITSERPASSDVMAWGWVDLSHFKAMAKDQIEQFKLPTNDLLPHLVFGGLIDAVIRSDHAWFSLNYTTHGPVLQLTTPQGRSVSQEGARVLHMHDPAKESILPLLSPPGTLFSSSFYWNLAGLWNDRTKVFKEGALKDFESGSKTIKPFLAGNSLSELLNTLGTRHRIVVSKQRDTGYTIKPKSTLPAFAMVVECKNPEQFNKMIALPLRTAGLLFSAQVSMKLFEEEFGQSKIIGYRFTDNAKNKHYDQGFLFNYSPSFARSGNFFIISSTRELCRDLITELAKPEATSSASDSADVRHRFSWAALGQALASERPRLATELTLRYGGSTDRIDQQISALLKLLDRLGTLDMSIDHSAGFRLEVRANYK